MAELKPCPFCGKAAELIETGGNHTLKMYRTTCKDGYCAGFNFKTYYSREVAIQKWNRRADNGN